MARQHVFDRGPRQRVTSRMFSSPGMPKTCVTPSFSRQATINSAVVRSGSPTRASLAVLTTDVGDGVAR